MSEGRVVAVARDGAHRFSKQVTDAVEVVAGLGIAGDAHQGVTVKHRSRARVDPDAPNLRQVHLIHAELLDELRGRGFPVAPGELGENVTTVGIDLLGLPKGARLLVGDAVVLEVTGLRNPCSQIERFRPGLLAAVIDRGPAGEVIRKAGVMAVAVAGGTMRAGDAVRVELPPEPHRALGVV